MKNIAAIIIIIFSLNGCSSQKKITETPPFSMNNASVQDWAAGREEGGTGYVLKLPLSMQEENLIIDKVYFRGHIFQPVVNNTDDGMELICEYSTMPKQKKPDIIMHADPMEEVGNQPPTLKRQKMDFPFDLESDEVVISYKMEGKKKTYYTKIGGIKEKSPKIYPSRPKN